MVEGGCREGRQDRSRVQGSRRACTLEAAAGNRGLGEERVLEQVAICLSAQGRQERGPWPGRGAEQALSQVWPQWGHFADPLGRPQEVSGTGVGGEVVSVIRGRSLTGPAATSGPSEVGPCLCRLQGPISQHRPCGQGSGRTHPALRHSGPMPGPLRRHSGWEPITNCEAFTRPWGSRPMGPSAVSPDLPLVPINVQMGMQALPSTNPHTTSPAPWALQMGCGWHPRVTNTSVHPCPYPHPRSPSS